MFPEPQPPPTPPSKTQTPNATVVEYDSERHEDAAISRLFRSAPRFTGQKPDGAVTGWEAFVLAAHSAGCFVSR